MKDARAEARVLLNDFNRWRLLTTAHAARKARGEYTHLFKEFTKKDGDRLVFFVEMAAWCRERQLDPRLWIFLLFRARAWTFPPQLARHHLMSETMVPRYAKLAERALDGYRTMLVKQHAQHSDFDPNVDISLSAESQKRRYSEAHQEERCMRETLERTYGFHPKSETCTACPIRLLCEKQLRELVPEFDIIALREGKISAETARALAEEHG